MLVQIDEEGTAFLDARECSKQVVLGDNGSLFTVDHRVQSELGEAELGAELGFQLTEGRDVAVGASALSIAPKVERSELAIVGGVDDVGGEGRHWWCLVRGCVR